MMLVTYSYRAVCIFHFIGRTPDVKSVVGKTRRTNFKKNCSLSDSPHYEKIIFCLLYVSLSLWLSSFSTCTSFRFNFCIFFSSPTANCLVPFFRKIRFLWGIKKNFYISVLVMFQPDFTPNFSLLIYSSYTVISSNAFLSFCLFFISSMPSEILTEQLNKSIQYPCYEGFSSFMVNEI